MAVCDHPEGRDRGWGRREAQEGGNIYIFYIYICFPSSSVVKNLLAVQEPQETWVQSLGPEDLWRRAWQPTPMFLPENPMDRGAWWAIVHRVAKSWTQ